MIHEETFNRIERLSPYVLDLLTEETLLFDIETTGLSPARDRIYCIGCGYLSGGGTTVELFLSEGPEEESLILERFLALVRTRPDLITFNGATFDIPFISKRLELCAGKTAVPDPARLSGSPLPGARSHLDIYREVRKMRGLLGLSSYKQKSIERFLGIDREDIYSGGELIGFCLEYERSHDPSLLAPMLTHNREDVAGMFDLLGVLACRQLAKGRFTLTDIAPEYGVGETTDLTIGSISIKIRPEYPLPGGLAPAFVGTEGCAQGCGISFIPDRGSAVVRIPVFHGELKHFFDDPENYFYLPDEDTAVHKSVGQFVDPPHRKKASKRTCFIKKECDYIALPVRAGCRFPVDKKTDPGGPGYLKRDYDDRDICLEIPAGTDSLKAALCAFFSRLNADTK